jgi:serine/threonine-protein kinase
VSETEQGDPFIVMELLHGETLAQILMRGRLSAVHAVQLLLPIIDACASAHARGIVHRDLKPDNLLIADEEPCIQPKILDFGIAKLTDPRDANHRLTEIGTVVGSPDYMSPEQARGCDDVDFRTDIWSICVVLYEAITGHPPFVAANYNALLRAIVENEPKSLLEEAAGDHELWQILRKGLSKERTLRHRSMSELGRALAAWLLKNGVHEDACGTSLESKWLGRSSDPLLEHNDTLRPNALPSAKLAAPHHASAAGVDSRGPFTATIRRKSAPTSLRRVAALGAIVAALGLATTIALSKTVAAGARAHAARAELMQVVTRDALPPGALPSGTPRSDESPAPTPKPVEAKSEIVAQGNQEPAPATAPIAVGVHARSATAGIDTHPIVTSHVDHRVVAEASTASTPTTGAAVKAAPRPLDLIAPY